MSDVDTALAKVDAFEASASQQVGWKLDRGSTLQRIRSLLRNPDLFDQRGLYACGPAAFFRVWFARDPVAAGEFSCALLRDGAAAIGTLNIAPSWRLREQDYLALRSATDAAHPNATPEGADWMLFSALRDSENVWFDYLGQPYTAADRIAGVTLPSTLASWLNATSLYATVENSTNVVFSGDRQHLLQLIPTSDVDAVLLVNTSAIYDLHPAPPSAPAPESGGFSIPDHYVLMTAPFSSWTDPAWLNIECWSWGRTYKGWQGSERFFNNYFGVVISRE